MHSSQLQFWTSFYEEAAQIRIPTFEEYSSAQGDVTQSEQEAETSRAPADDDSTHPHPEDPGDASTQSAFDQVACSSTPATTSRHRSMRDTFTSHVSAHSEAPWADSMEAAPPADASDPRDVLFETLRNPRDKPLATRHVSPLKLRPKIKTPIPKNLNPYLPENADPADWSGIVDLRDPTLATPKRPMFPTYRRPTPRPKPVEDSFDDSYDGLPPGMSPPHMMSPAPPPRPTRELGLLGLSQSPLKDAAERIKHDLLSDTVKQSGGSRFLLNRSAYGSAGAGAESTMSTVPTPPSLSRYTSQWGFQDTGSVLDPNLEHRADSDSDSDSDEVNNTAHPSAAFLLASQQSSGKSLDDSDDSLNRSGYSVDGNAMQAAGFGNYHFDDSFDDEQGQFEETVFGLPPAQAQNRLRAQNPDDLRLLGSDFVEETIGMGQRRAERGIIDESPTPWGGPSER
jgi:DASH complex subunit ASK1